MYSLFERRNDKEDRFLGDYNSLGRCEDATEVVVKQLKELGDTRAMFYCTEKDEDEIVAGWIYRWAEDKVVCS